MKIFEIITEAKFRKPIVMYHGTSSAFLRSILKHGMLPKTKEKVWDKDPHAVDANAFSLVSVGGSYWTSDQFLAIHSARVSAERFGGNKTIVVAQIAEGSAIADEDRITEKILTAFRRALVSVSGATEIKDIEKYIDVFVDKPIKKRRFLDIFSRTLHADLTKKSEKTPMPTDLLQETCMTIVKRSLAYAMEHFTKKASLRNIIKNIPYEIPTIGEAEQEAMSVIDKLTRYYRETVYKKNTEEKHFHTLRIDAPVGFSGANKIIAIIEIEEDGSVIVRYGKESMAGEFVDQWNSTNKNRQELKLKNENK